MEKRNFDDLSNVIVVKGEQEEINILREEGDVHKEKEEREIRERIVS